MTGSQKALKTANLTEEQEKEGYWVGQSGSNVLVWHRNSQIALLCFSPDIDHKVQEVVKRRREEYKEVEERTGWKPN